MGNSEVGHLNIGAGRVVYQELTRINLAVEDRSLFDEPGPRRGDRRRRSRDGRAVHFMGLLSDGGVHSHQRAPLRAARDGARARGASGSTCTRSSTAETCRPKAASASSRTPSGSWATLGAGEIATVMGRYYAMDRDNRWDRVERAWRAMVLGEGVAGRQRASTRSRASYEAGVTDEFVVPAVVAPARVERRRRRRSSSTSGPTARARSPAPSPTPPSRGSTARSSRSVRFVCLTEYDPTIPAPVAFPKELPQHVLADVLAEKGLTPAPHRRDREVRARDVLLQRRGRGAEAGRDARAGPESRRSPPTTSSPR